MITIDKIHTTYNYIEFNIITDQPEELSAKIIEVVNRSYHFRWSWWIYTPRKSMIYLIVMNFERHKVLEAVKG